ncbi:16880_t:CDS:2 [Funneliformis mosseae]|uniref:16880_t:CDS:1 n=1 Tax=Funneliformis mosseae TaxID=27381 RepID=A0A9N9BPT4_FUNMO|nr:16880_t:CDS:2 [Funneliformis mosseae]
MSITGGGLIRNVKYVGYFFFFEEIQDASTHHLEPSQSTDSNRFKAQLEKRNFLGKELLQKLIFYSEWLIQDKSKKIFKIVETIKDESSLAEWLTKAVVDLISFYLNEELVISTLCFGGYHTYRITPTQRKKCEHLITELVYQRDLIRQLLKNKISSPRFEWLYQMRFYFNACLEHPLVGVPLTAFSSTWRFTLQSR